MQPAKFPLGSKGHLETPLCFVSWILSRVVRGQHKPGKEHHEDRKESRQTQPCDSCKSIYMYLSLGWTGWIGVEQRDLVGGISPHGRGIVTR